jgi:ABC-type phosphate transport system substrate-binding protein
MTQDHFSALGARKMVHVPFCLGAIGVFHSVPAAEVGNDGLKLDACLLAKIFSGQITTWDHAEIRAQNPMLAVPSGQKIIVGHRTHGSSSTGGFTLYLNQKCPSGWKLAGQPIGSDSTVTWSTSDNFRAVEGSQGMTAHIENTPYAIGYIDAGH